HIATVAQTSRALSDPTEFPLVQSVVPLHRLPESVQLAFRSQDESTYLLPVTLKSGIEMEAIHEAVNRLQARFAPELDPSVTMYVTGPAGIASDAIAIFQNADLVLLFATLLIILVLLIA